MNRLLHQQILNGSPTGGPVVPVPVNPLIQSSYEGVLPQDQFINNWESSSLVTLSGFHSSTVGADDHTMSTNLDKVIAKTASVDGSNSSTFIVVGGLLNQRHYTNTLTSTTIDSSLSALPEEGKMGVFTIRKLFYGTKIEPGSLTATATGTNSYGVDMAGDYYDSGSGEIKAKTQHGAVLADGTIGVMLVDEGMLAVTASTMREVATAITAVKYRTNVLNTTISIFCKSSPDAQNFTLNPTSFSISAISGTETSAEGLILQSYNNILIHSSITANTDRAHYMPGLVSSGANWTPYITSVGLFGVGNELLAIAKVATPMKKPSDLPLTFKVQIDV